VPESEYESTRDELKEALLDLEGPGGTPVADRVVERDEAFRGDHVDIAPDLVVIPNHGFDLKSGFGNAGDVFTTGPRNGMHSFDDATLYVGDPNATIDDVDLLDIAPTILELLDVDVNRTEFDGASML
jgi:predicted AlkP superfamily phosphohydrolase/phosphomutase